MQTDQLFQLYAQILQYILTPSTSRFTYLLCMTYFVKHFFISFHFCRWVPGFTEPCQHLGRYWIFWRNVPKTFWIEKSDSKNKRIDALQQVSDSRNPLFGHKYLAFTDSILSAMIITQKTCTHDLKINFRRKRTWTKKFVFFNPLKNSFYIIIPFWFSLMLYSVLCRHQKRDARVT